MTALVFNRRAASRTNPVSLSAAFTPMMETLGIVALDREIRQDRTIDANLPGVYEVSSADHTSYHAHDRFKRDDSSQSGLIVGVHMDEIHVGLVSQVEPHSTGCMIPPHAPGVTKRFPVHHSPFPIPYPLSPIPYSLPPTLPALQTTPSCLRATQT